MDNGELQKTIEVLKSVTLESANISPDVRKDFNLSSGMQEYNLEQGAKFLFPLMSPLRNILPRVGGKGKQVEYKAITGINTTGDQGWVAEGVSGNILSSSYSDVFAVYRTMSQGDRVTFEQQWAGAGFIDSKATAVANLLRSIMITEEKNILFGQNTVSATNQQAPGAVGTCPAPTITASATGGAIGAVTVYVQITARTGMGQSLPSAVVSTAALTGSTNSVNVAFPSIPGQPVLGYDVFAGTSATALYKVGASNVSGSLGGVVGTSTMTSNGAPVTLTSIPVSGAVPPTSDNSANANAYNGILAQIFGGVGATITQVNGVLSNKSAIDNHLLKMWQASYADPNMLLVNGADSTTITNLTLGASGTPYFVMVDNQGAATGSYRTARYVNPVTGTELPVISHPYMPQGTMLALSTKLPSWYVPSNIPAPIAVDAVQDYTEIDYPPVYGTRAWPVEVMLYSTLKLYIPLLQGVITGILA